MLSNPNLTGSQIEKIYKLPNKDNPADRQLLLSRHPNTPINVLLAELVTGNRAYVGSEIITAHPNYLRWLASRSRLSQEETEAVIALPDDWITKVL